MLQDKKLLRETYLAVRRSLSEERRQRALAAFELQIADLLSISGTKAAPIGCYFPLGTELSLVGWMKIQEEQGRSFCLPRTKEGALNFAAWRTEDELAKTPFGTHEPSHHAREVLPELLIIPCIAASKDGFRLGYGGGYYDRFLEKHPECRTIGIVFAECLLDAFPRETHDIAMQHLIIV